MLFAFFALIHQHKRIINHFFDFLIGNLSVKEYRVPMPLVAAVTGFDGFGIFLTKPHGFVRVAFHNKMNGIRSLIYVAELMYIGGRKNKRRIAVRIPHASTGHRKRVFYNIVFRQHTFLLSKKVQCCDV